MVTQIAHQECGVQLHAALKPNGLEALAHLTGHGQVLDLRDAKGNTVEPFMFAGTNYIPARALAESLGLQVAWDGSTATVVLTHPEASKPTYITRTGSKYHNDPHCNGGTYWEVPYSTATGMGLTPCDKCVH